MFLQFLNHGIGGSVQSSCSHSLQFLYTKVESCMLSVVSQAFTVVNCHLLGSFLHICMYVLYNTYSSKRPSTTIEQQRGRDENRYCRKHENIQA
jgi:hypothetical protein